MPEGMTSPEKPQPTPKETGEAGATPEKPISEWGIGAIEAKLEEIREISKKKSESERAKLEPEIIELANRKKRLLTSGKKEAANIARLMREGLPISNRTFERAEERVERECKKVFPDDDNLRDELEEANFDLIRAECTRFEEMEKKVTPRRPAEEKKEITPSQLTQMFAEALRSGGELPGPEQFLGLTPSQFRPPENLEERKKEFVEKIEFLERSRFQFENTANYQILSQLMSALRQMMVENERLRREKSLTSEEEKRVEINENLIDQFWARYALHGYNLYFRNAPNIGTMLEQSGLINPERLQILFRIPGVAEGFRIYEKKGYEFISTKGEAKNRVREEIAREIEGKVKNSVKGEVAQRIAENLWFVTGRAAYFDATNPNEKQRIKREGPFILARLFNFPDWSATKPNIREFWKTEEERQYLDLGIRDFWSESWKPILELEENKQTVRGNVDVNKKTGWIEGLSQIPFEKLDLKDALSESAFIMHMDSTNKADACRPLLVDPGAFLELPSWDNFTKLWEVFEHLGERKKGYLARFAEGMLKFNRRRSLFPGKRSFSEKELKWEPWASERVYSVIEDLIKRGIFTRGQGKSLEKKYGATRFRAGLKSRGVDLAKSVPGAVLGMVWDFLKALFGLK